MTQPISIGASISMDLGSGTPELLPKKDLGPTIRLSGSLDGFGVRTLSFERFGRNQSLWKTALLRSMLSVTLTGYRGQPGSITEYDLFEGWLREATFDADTGIASLTCQDVSLPFVDALLFLNIESGTGATRKSVIEDLFTDLGWPVGTLDFPNTDGGYIFKAISEGGDRRVSEWLADVLVPIGRRARWKDGAIQIERFDTSGVAVRTLGPGEIRSLTMQPPPTNAPNRVAMSSSIYPYTGLNGRRTTGPVTVSTYGDITPEVAINVQDHTTGTITATGLTATPLTGVELTRTETWETHEGGALISRTVKEYGWCAPVACNQKQDASGTITYNDDFDVYEFATARTGLRGNIQAASGYWRTQQEETFQLLRTTVTEYYFNTSHAKEGERETITELMFVEMPCGYTEDHSVEWTGPTTFFPAYLCADDRAHINGKEEMVSFLVTRGNTYNPTGYYTYDADTLEVTGWTYRLWNSMYVAGRTVALLSGSDPAHADAVGTRSWPVYEMLTWNDTLGLVYRFVHFFRRSGGTYGGAYEAGRVYWQGTPSANSCYDDGVYALTDIDGSSYTQDYTSSGYGVTYTGLVMGGAVCVQTNGFPSRVASSSDVISEPLPIIDTWTEGQSPTPTTVTAVDAVRTALSDGIAIPAYRQTDYAENTEQLHLAAFDELRNIGAPVVTIETDWFMDITEGVVIAVDSDELGTEPVKLLVESFDASLDISNGDNSMTLSCRWFPPELSTAPTLTAEVLE